MPAGAEDVGEAGGLQSSDQRRADEPAVTRDVHRRVARHCMGRHSASLPTPSGCAQDSALAVVLMYGPPTPVRLQSFLILWARALAGAG